MLFPLNNFVASRGIPSISELTPLWYHGPPFLKFSKDEWPVFTQVPSIAGQELELKPTTVVSLSAAEPERDLFTHLSSWTKVIQVTSVIVRWCFLVRCKPQKPTSIREYALFLIVKYIQRQAFANDMKAIMKGRVPRPSIQRLAPFIDEMGVLRIKGRLANVPAPARPCPMLLPKRHRLLNLLVRHYHECLGHAGPSQVRFQLSWTYWILSARHVVRQVIHGCVKCFRVSPKLDCPLMGDLPAVRVNPSPPFWHTGMDYCGPFLVRPHLLRKATLVKVYLCIFVCMTTKAVHLEVAHDLSTNAFIDVLKRFVSRRGAPSRLYSDCGTNFVGARAQLDKELRNLLMKHSKDELVRHFLVSNQIEFETIPPSAPHQGGLWERAVGSAKYHLKRVIGASSLVLFQLVTLTTQVEAILNSRPITPMSADAEDYYALTPAHFLIGRPLVSFPEEDMTHLSDGSLRHYQLITAMVQRFWKQWRLEYLTTLQSRSKWINRGSNLELGDIVIVSEPNCPPLMWPLGKITQVYPGQDGVVRRVAVATRGGVYDRPVVKVFRLPINHEH